MMLDKGHELAKQSTNVKDAKAVKKLLDQIRSDWDKLRQETVNRHRRLQTCMELVNIMPFYPSLFFFKFYYYYFF